MMFHETQFGNWINDTVQNITIYCYTPSWEAFRNCSNNSTV